jgi:hypothetical protein
MTYGSCVEIAVPNLKNVLLYWLEHSFYTILSSFMNLIDINPAKKFLCDRCYSKTPKKGKPI